MILIYDGAGRITQVMTVYPPDYLEGLEDHGLQGVELPTGDSVISDWFIKDGKPERRADAGVPATLDIEVGEIVKFNHLPACRVFMGSESIDVPAGEFSFTGESPGVYSLHVQCWPMKDFNMEITVK